MKHIHRDGNVVILTKFSLLAALEVDILITSGAATDENFIKSHFCFNIKSLHCGIWDEYLVSIIVYSFLVELIDMWCQIVASRKWSGPARPYLSESMILISLDNWISFIILMSLLIFVWDKTWDIYMG